LKYNHAAFILQTAKNKKYKNTDGVKDERKEKKDVVLTRNKGKSDMKVLLLNGSPHEKGCVYTALSEVEKTLKSAGLDTEIFWIGNKPVADCIACGKCHEQKECCF